MKSCSRAASARADATVSGVTVTVGDDVYTGITPDGFRDFWNDRILPAVGEGKGGIDVANCLTLKKSNCKNCYKCIRHCPVKSIRFSGNQAHIIGKRMHSCAGSALWFARRMPKQIVGRDRKGEGPDPVGRPRLCQSGAVLYRQLCGTSASKECGRR